MDKISKNAGLLFKTSVHLDKKYLTGICFSLIHLHINYNNIASTRTTLTKLKKYNFPRRMRNSCNNYQYLNLTFNNNLIQSQIFKFSFSTKKIPKPFWYVVLLTFAYYILSFFNLNTFLKDMSAWSMVPFFRKVNFLNDLNFV